MRLVRFIIVIVLIAYGNILNAQNTQNLKAINNDVWSKFYLAFDSLDFNLMAEIHSKKLIRIPANQKKIIDYEAYIGNYKKRFRANKEKNVTLNISLRFFERITSELNASERGIYRLIVSKGSDEEKIYYGEFHVLHIKEKGIWKILMDYDSNESGKIGVNDFEKSFAIDDFDKFYQEKKTN